MLCADPEFSSPLTVTTITQTSVTLSWSLVPSQTIDSTLLFYRLPPKGWNHITVTGTSHTMTRLQPGSLYWFAVRIFSYGKPSQTNTFLATTGK